MMEYSTTASALLTIMMLAAVLLAWGGVKLRRLPENRSKGTLMVVAAAVLLANVLIWTVPL